MRGLSGNCGIAGNFDVSRRGFNEAAVSTSGSRSIKRAAYVYGAVLHASQKHYRAVSVFDAMCLDYAGVVHGTLQEIPGSLGCHQHLPTVGTDQTTILNKRIYRALIYRHIEQSIACNVKGDGIAGSKCHRTEFCRDHTVVADIGAQQRDIATVAVGAYRSLVVDLTTPRTAKRIRSCHEVTFGDVKS